MNFIDIFFLGQTLAMTQIADIVISESQNPWIYVKDKMTSFSFYSGHQRIHALKAKVSKSQLTFSLILELFLKLILRMVIL